MNIGTRRLRLRPVEQSDAHLLHRLDADPEVMRFVSGGEPTPSATIRDWVIPRSQAQFRSSGTGMWLLFDRREDRFIGWVQLRVPRHSAALELELSYRLHRWSWGRGVATEAASALVAVAFTATDTDRIFAGTHPANRGSQRVMVKLGMRPAASAIPPVPRGGARQVDGSRQVDGTDPLDDVEYELMRADWERSRLPARTADMPA
ncbi:GNAT family N-acetyltransferase [Gordonia shandongensis]|uniref:GNAT family N-acetyltransferase n=1 Tax=Gordonia shandongensis TaxID=376351 RepID=UPI000401D074|nr:GNAT family N-acetyltransferase [Gordonia shandongensis]